MNALDRNKGFSLIELLLVIAIIGLLAGIIIFAVESSRTKARNAYSNETVLQYVNAIEVYRLHNSTYPYVSRRTCLGDRIGASYCYHAEVETYDPPTNLNNLRTAVQPYMAAFPSINTRATYESFINADISTGIYECTDDPLIAGTCDKPRIRYMLEGRNAKCVRGVPVAQLSTHVACEYAW